MIKQPTFFIVGAPRSGTTALYEFLKEHPQIFMTEHKEPHYFASDFPARNPWMKAFRKKRNYFYLFSSAKNEKQLGEASVLYLLSKKAAKNIRKYNKNVKIIIMLRSPLEVMYSLYYQLHYGGDEPAATFREALSLEMDRKHGKKIPKSLRISQFYFYREIVKFNQQVKRYISNFGKDQIKVVIYEDFKKRQLNTYRDILEFLDVDINFAPMFRKVNANRVHRNLFLQSLMNKTAIFLSKFGFDLYLYLRPLYKWIESFNLVVTERPEMDKDLELKLKKEYLPEMKKLSKLIGRDVTYWCKY